jgi:hypothetical protein
MMAAQRQRVKYCEVFPDAQDRWAMRFEFATATRIIFGEGTATTLPDLARSFGSRPC